MKDATTHHQQDQCQEYNRANNLDDMNALFQPGLLIHGLVGAPLAFFHLQCMASI